VLAKYRTSRSVDAYWEAYRRLAAEKEKVSHDHC